MPSSGRKHLVEGELSVEVPLDDVHPFRVSWLIVQLLNTQRHFDLKLLDRQGYMPLLHRPVGSWRSCKPQI